MMSVRTQPHPARIPGDGASTSALIAWAMYDWASSAFATLIQTFIFAAYFIRRVAPDAATGSLWWGRALSASSLVAALMGPLLGAVADQTGGRKRWLAVFTGLCVAATALLWFAEPAPHAAGRALLLVALGTAGAEAAGIFYNAMLPVLTGPRRIGRWSGWGWGLGYVGGLMCLLLALSAFVREESPWVELDRAAALDVRATFPFAAGWYFVFSLPLFLFTPDVPGTGIRLRAALRAGWRQLSTSIRQARRYAGILRFLIARMLYTDGLATVFLFGGIYAAGAFDMTAEDVVRFGIALNIAAGLGAAAFAWVDDRVGGRQTILIALSGLIAATTLMLLTTNAEWFWVLGMVLGLFVGPVQAASRSYLARVSPAEMRTEFFGLYAFAGKATAFVGPLLVGWVTYATGSQRLGMATVLVFFLAGLVVLLTVPSDTTSRRVRVRA